MDIVTFPSRSSLFLRALVNIFFGGIILAYPGLTLAVIAIAFAINLLITGLFMIFEPAYDSANQHSILTVIFGILGVIAGIYLISKPLTSIEIVSLLVAVWAMLFGFIDLFLGFSANKNKLPGTWAIIIVGILSIIFGSYLAFNPLEGSLALVGVVGVYAILVGIVVGIEAIFYNSIFGKAVKKTRRRKK